MTLIKSNLISPNQALRRNIRREHNRNNLMLVNFINTYFAELNKFKGDRTLAKPCFDLCNFRWRGYVATWNADPTRLSKLRGTDFEDFIEDYFKKQKANEKNSWWKTCCAVLRSFINRLWLRSGSRYASDGFRLR
jgi:hypothetical protein